VLTFFKLLQLHAKVANLFLLSPLLVPKRDLEIVLVQDSTELCLVDSDFVGSESAGQFGLGGTLRNGSWLLCFEGMVGKVLVSSRATSWHCQIQLVLDEQVSSDSEVLGTVHID